MASQFTLHDLRGGGRLDFQFPLQCLTQLRQVPISFDLAEPWLDLQQRGGQSTSPLMGIPSVIDVRTPLFHHGIDRLQTIGGFERCATTGNIPNRCRASVSSRPSARLRAAHWLRASSPCCSRRSAALASPHRWGADRSVASASAMPVWSKTSCGLAGVDFQQLPQSFPRAN